MTVYVYVVSMGDSYDRDDIGVVSTLAEARDLARRYLESGDFMSAHESFYVSRFVLGDPAFRGIDEDIDSFTAADLEVEG